MAEDARRVLLGDATGLPNVPRIKGPHQAIRSGMLAAEHLVQSSRASEVMPELKTPRLY